MKRPAIKLAAVPVLFALLAFLYPSSSDATVRLLAVLNRAVDVEVSGFEDMDACMGHRLQNWAIVEGERTWTTF